MRPRKVILLVNANETALGIQRYMLAMHGYRVMAAQGADDALALFAPDVDLVLGMAGGDGADGPAVDWNALSRQVKALCTTTPVVLAGELLNADELAAVDSVLTAKRLRAMELLECIKVRIARKRGPKKNLPVLAPAMAGD